MRVFAYTVPVIIISIIVNIPKFLETKIVVENNVTPIDDESYEEAALQDDDYRVEDDVMMKDRRVMSYLTYTIDVTDLR